MIGAAHKGLPRGCFLVPALIVLLTILSAPALANQALTIDADSQLAFAESNFSQGEYYRAVSEYRRFLYFFPNDDRAPQAALRIGQSYYLGQDYEEAQKALKSMAAQYPQSPLAAEASLLICQCSVKIQDYEEARTCLSDVVQNAGPGELAQKARYDAGWVYVLEGDFNAAAGVFKGMDRSVWDKYRIPALVAEIDKAGDLQYKSPGTAGVLAVVPGLGHVYTNRYQDAAIAFLLNAGLIIAAYESFDNDQEALGSVIGVVGFGFYAGNIYSAASSAHKYNRRQKAAFTKSLEQVKVRVSAGALPDGTGQGASLTIPF
ncbi:conserved hypothetical protein [Desulfatibacillum aliphaticivorans]|uniref:Uncharacterized protein n=1 Tax=Desulfatibacillum aliphaticivorans TaxID=218208 RepID=B8FE32_DESAL|nr:tetratricopeptide repeat protein [Desulfatibacillum aliphaticivorans]ACL06813.1 conserved hypothetical protein [Desulfatibacillum aliphaticivorans]